MWDKIGELWFQTRIITSFWYNILCVLTLITQKRQVIHCIWMFHISSAWLLCYWRCLFPVLELDVRYDWWAITPNMHHSPFSISNLYILTRITWKLQVIYEHSAYWTTPLLLKTFLVCIRVAWRIQLESYSTRHASVVLWYNILWVYCKPVHS